MPVRSDHRLALGIATLLAVAATGLAAWPHLPGVSDRAQAARKPPRPNIVLIQTDDQTLNQLSRRAMPKTKRLIARHGTTFRNYMVTTAQCCPSRASVLTGQYAHNHGVTSNNVGYPKLVEKRNVLPVWLQRAGYKTIHVGKYLNAYERVAQPDSEVAPGWDRWHTVLGATRYYGYDYFVDGETRHHGHSPSDNVTHVLNTDAARLARRFARRAPPFFLEFDQRVPHGARQKDPFGPCSRSPQPERRDEGRFADAALPKPPSFNEGNMSDKPPFLREKPKLGPRSRHKVRKRWRCGLAALAGVDRGVAKVYSAVRKAGELNRTVFVFISDNGKFFGQHRIQGGKVYPYEEAIRLPLLIRTPKRYRNGAHRVRSVGKPVANIDLAPTILDLARARPCARRGDCRTMDGRSLLPLLKRSGGWPAGRGLLTEYRVHDLGRYSTCDFDGIRTRTTIYVEHSRVVDPRTGQCESADQRERYDLAKDPYELHNRCFDGRPSSCPNDAEQLDLERRLDRLRDCAGVAGRDRRVSGHPFCE
jgi:arylsulfatase A-like enzyme